jgi:phospholipid-binding lipoprotein MlaA
MNVPNYRRLTQPRKRLRAEENIKTIHTVPLVLLVLCFSMNPNLCFGESSISLHPEEAFVSAPTENELIQTDEEIIQNFAMAPSEPAGEETVQNSAMTPSEPAEEEAGAEEIPDPLQPMNRAFFKFNDKLYFWVLKPVASGYKSIVPEDARIGVRNFFSNLTTPIRLVNCLLQADFKGGGTEAIRLVVNSTFGLAGFLDPAKKEFHIEKRDKDFGQTLGVYGMRPVFYIDLPILGPSSLRDSIGLLGDLALDPRTYVFNEPWTYVVWGARSVEVVNSTSLTIGVYEDLKKAAVDPYVAVRNAYFQYREHKIRNR